MMHLRRVLFLLLVVLLTTSLVVTVLAPFERDSPLSDRPPTSVRFRSGHLEAELAATLTAAPDDRTALLALAELYAHTNHIDQAIALYERALALRPDDVTARLGFAQALLAHGLIADAESQLRAALALDPTNQQVLYLLGQAAERRRPPDLAAARDWYQRAAAAGDGPYARLAQQRLLELDRP